MDIKHEIIEPNFTVRVFNELKGKNFHWHQRMEFVYVESGYCDVVLKKKIYRANTGDVIFIHSGEIHELHSDCNDMHIKIFTFNPSLLQQLNSEFIYINNHITYKMQEDTNINEKVKFLVNEIYEEYKENKHLSDSIVISDLIKLYSFLARHFQNTKMMENKNSTKIKAFQKALEYISENYTENISLKNVAEKINYCEAYVSTLFVAFTGVNFKTYIDTIRIKHAVDLLEKTDNTIAYIATLCGYDNLKTFNNTFKRITNKTPREFRGNNL